MNEMLRTPPRPVCEESHMWVTADARERWPDPSVEVYSWQLCDGATNIGVRIASYVCTCVCMFVLLYFTGPY